MVLLFNRCSTTLAVSGGQSVTTPELFARAEELRDGGCRCRWQVHVSMNNSAPVSTTEALGSGVTATLVLGKGLASGGPPR